MTLPKGHVWITGASSGIGWASALLLARSGWDVAASSRNEQALEALQQKHESIHAYPLDVTDPIARVETYERIRNELGPVDVLVNNAGYGIRGAIEESDLYAMRALYDVNLYAPLALSKLVLPEMRRRHGGRIINVSSVLGRVTTPFNGVYASSKFALEAMSDSLRMELTPWSTKVILVEPGPIRTRFSSTAKSHSLSKLTNSDSPYAPYYKRFLGGALPTQRFAWGAASVAEVIRLAAETDRPKVRYTVHPYARWLPIAAKLLTATLVDRLFCTLLGLNKPVYQR